MTSLMTSGATAVSLDPRHFDLMRSPDVRAAIAALWEKGFVPHGRTDLPPYPFALPFDWAQDPFADSNWKFQLHAWRMLDPPLRLIARGPAKAVGLLADCLSIIADWARAEAAGAAGEFAWYDMAVGIRATKLALLVEALRAAGEAAPQGPEGLDLTALAERHMAELADPGLLSDNNHGLFQLHGLMALVGALPDHPLAAERRAFAAYHMAGLIGRQFGPLGVHTENSPSYHFFALERIEPMLDSPWWRLPEMAETHARLATARQAGLWLVDPAGRTPPIGDSAEGVRVRDFAGLRDWPHRERNGMLGAVVDGYGVVRSAPEAGPERAALLFLTASFQNLTHKHADCLSFVWQEDGESILIDSGKYGYKSGVMRSYFVSPRAHSTVEIEGVRLSRSRPYGSGLRRVVPAGDLWLVDAEASRGALRHGRSLLYHPGRFVLAIDRIAPSDEAPPGSTPKGVTSWWRRDLAIRRAATQGEALEGRSVTSWWHFHPNLAIRRVEAAGPAGIAAARLEGLRKGAALEILHLDNARDRDVKSACGAQAPSLQGWISRGYLKAEPAPALGFTGRAQQDYVAATLIERVPAGGEAAFGLRWIGPRTVALRGPDLAADPAWPGGVLDLGGFALRLDPTAA